MLNRRKFLAGVAAGVGAAKGEAPVRSTLLRANFWGPLYYDEKERQEVVEVLEIGRPFRWYGPGTQPPMKVATFEKEFLCFYDSTIWTPSLIPPLGCLNAPVSLFPGSLTFDGQAVGATSAPKAAILRNIGPTAVTIAGIVSSGDFAQANDCPKSMAAGAVCTIAVVFKPSAAGIRSGAVSIVDVLRNSPQTLSLAGLGLAAP